MKSTNAFERQDLPVDFQPRSMDVIIGRGKQVNKHNDKNVILQDLLATFAGDYLYGKKERKSELLTIVVQEICATGCAFIKKDTASGNGTGLWYSVDETAARNSAAQFLRNHLSENYKSSKQFKKKLRMDKKKADVDVDVDADVRPDSTNNERVSPSSSQSSLSSSSSSRSSRHGHSSSGSPNHQHQHERLVPSSYNSRYSHSMYNNSTWNKTRHEQEPLINLLPAEPMSIATAAAASASARVFRSNKRPMISLALPPTEAGCGAYEPRPLGGPVEQPFSQGVSPLFGDAASEDLSSVFHSLEDEELFLSWSQSTQQAV